MTSSYWSMSVTDEPDFSTPPEWYAPKPQPLDIDPWESPANVQQGVSSVSGTPFVNPVGQAPAPGVQAAPRFTGSAQVTPIVSAPTPFDTMPVPPVPVYQPPVAPDTRNTFEKGLDFLLNTNPRLASSTGSGVSVNRGPSVAQATQPLPGAEISRAIGGELGASAIGGLLMPQLTATGTRVPFLENIGRDVGEELAPQTPLDLLLAPVLGLTPWDQGLSMGARAGSAVGTAAKEAATSYVDNAARAGAGAVPPGAVRRTVADAAPLRAELVGEDVYRGSRTGGAGNWWSTDPAYSQSYGGPALAGRIAPNGVLDVTTDAGRAELRAIISELPYAAGDKRALLEWANEPSSIPYDMFPELGDAIKAKGYQSVRSAQDFGAFGAVGHPSQAPVHHVLDQSAVRPPVSGSNIPRGISPTEGEGIMRTAGAAGKAKPSSWDDIQKGWITPEGKLVTAENAGWNHGDIARRTLGLDSEGAALDGGFVRFRADPTGIFVEGADPSAVMQVARMYNGDRTARIMWDVGPPSKTSLTRENAGSATVGDILAGRAGPTDPNTGAFIGAKPSPSTAVPEASPVGLTDAASSPPSGGPPSGAAAGGEDPGFAANIRLSKYSEDVRAPIAQWAADNPDVVQQARRGIQTDEAVRANARALVEDMGGDFDKLQKSWKPGQAWNAEEVTAIRGALNDATRNVMDAAEKARLGGLEAQTNLAEAILKQQEIQKTVHGVTAEAGRSLRAFRQSADAALADGDVRRVQELLRLAIGKSDPADIAELSDAIKALDVNNPTAVSNFIRKVNKPDFWDKLHFYWMNSILSGPVTQLRNISGNVGTAAYSPVQRLGAAAIEQPLAAMQGRQAQRFWQGAPASVAGLFQGMPEGTRAALATLKTGISPRAAAKLDVRPAPIGGVAGRILGAPTTMLGVADEFFSAINYRSALNAEAVRMARMQGLKGDALTKRISDLVADPPPQLMDKATKHAEHMVFRDDPGDLARGASYLRSKIPFRAGRYIVPFLNTPANLLKYGIKNSPLGLLDAGAWQKAIKGNPEGADELASAFLGTMVAASVAAAVGTGVMDITVAPPVDRAERDRFYREGKIPNAVRIPGVGWVEYRQLPMLDTTLTLVGSIVDGVRRGEDVSAIPFQALANIGTNLTDKSYMSGLSDFFDVIEDPARYAERYATRQVSGFAPFSGASRQTAGALDQTVRDPQGLTETLKTQIPGLSDDVPPRLTAFGEEASKGLPSPMRISTKQGRSVDAELERLGVEVGFVGNTMGGEKLSREDKATYQQIAGQVTLWSLSTLLESPDYQKLDDAQKQGAYETAIDRSKSRVRDVMASEEFKSLSDEQQQQVVDRLLERVTELLTK